MAFREEALDVALRRVRLRGEVHLRERARRVHDGDERCVVAPPGDARAAEDAEELTNDAGASVERERGVDRTSDDERRRLAGDAVHPCRVSSSRRRSPAPESQRGSPGRDLLAQRRSRPRIEAILLADASVASCGSEGFGQRGTEGGEQLGHRASVTRRKERRERAGAEARARDARLRRGEEVDVLLARAVPTARCDGARERGLLEGSIAERVAHAGRRGGGRRRVGRVRVEIVQKGREACAEEGLLRPAVDGERDERLEASASPGSSSSRRMIGARGALGVVALVSVHSHCEAGGLGAPLGRRTLAHQLLQRARGLVPCAEARGRARKSLAHRQRRELVALEIDEHGERVLLAVQAILVEVDGCDTRGDAVARRGALDHQELDQLLRGIGEAPLADVDFAGEREARLRGWRRTRRSPPTRGAPSRRRRGPDALELAPSGGARARRRRPRRGSGVR
jgi:hypothetical protein